MSDVKKVLLVEDEKMCAMPVMMILKKLGCDVTHASSPDQALACSKVELFNLIIMDIGLGPGQIDGVDVARLIKETGRLNEKTPVVALTGRSVPDDKGRCLDAGMKDFYIKPASPDVLKEILEKFAN